MNLALRPFACWDFGYEFRRGHGCLPVVSAACCQVEFSVSRWSLVQRNSIVYGVSDYVREAWTVRRPWPTRGCCPIEKSQYMGADKSLADPTKKTIERSPFFVLRGGHCCCGDLVGRTTFWIIFWVACKKSEFRRCSLFPSWSG